ncbi:MAG: 16S rRNA (cytosine1402-N4)-methyltransferase [Microgenomates group bacterium Gr01-1014_16]|nr:MAG: 16S rRNA (cytosine1402-N4)-methyltransferase [Microgenomates group bacterium Gr01-1014_16]
MTYHNPVLLQEAVAFLAVCPGKKYIDCTLGGGGHTLEILKQGGNVLAMDQDPDAITESLACLAPPKPLGEGGPDLVIVHSNFIHLTEVANQYGFNPVSGVLIDLGVSEHQIFTDSRGFSFQKDGPLDMRMDPSLSNTAADLVNKLTIQQLNHLLKSYGEIPVSKYLARKIVENRPFSTTFEFARTTGKWSQQAFQALRIAVNDELGALKSVLPQAYDLLEPGGRLVVISFHSLEDRLVKQQFSKDKLIKYLSGEKNAKLRVYVKT